MKVAFNLIVEFSGEIHVLSILKAFLKNNKKNGTVAQSVMRLLGMHSDPRLTPMYGTFFREDLVMKTFLQSFILFC